MGKKIVSYNKKHQQLLITGNKIQSVNKREMLMMNRLDTSRILRVSSQKETPPVRLYANTQGLVPISEYLRTVSMTKKLFVCIINSILDSVDYAESIHFSKDLLVYKTQYAFVRVSDLSVVLAYVPLQPCTLEETISDLFESIIRESVFDPTEDASYISSFAEIIQNKSFSLYVLKEYLRFISEERTGILLKADEDEILGQISESDKFKFAGKSELCGNSENPSVSLHKPQINQPSDNKNNSAYKLIVNEDSSGNVTVFRAAAHSDRELISRNGGKSIVINKSPLRIGKLFESSDLRIENHAVSRKHAEIVKEGENYYVIDYYSKNGTYINGRRIESGVKELLHINDLIRFADSEYQFK